jgi:GNAT superfamily N-acetyltransferase
MEESQEPLTKRQKLTEYQNFTIVNYVRANDAITILIQTPFSSYLQSGGNPWYTHQVFPDEQLRLLSTHFPSQSRVYIIIDAQSLRFYVDVCLSGPVAEDIKTTTLSYLQQHICPLAVPSDATFRIVDDQGFDPNKSRPTPTLSTELLRCAPFGLQCKEYPSLNSQDVKFQAYLVSHRRDSTKASELLARLEKLAMWYIETASSVNFTDDKWEMLVLYEVNKESNGSNQQISCIAGYLTLYTFHNPFLGSKIRICQALVMPHHQGKGLGRMLLRAAYDLAMDRSHIVEITVEDPCEAFQNLRDQIDFEYFVNKYDEHNASKASISTAKTTDLKGSSSSENIVEPNKSTGFVFAPLDSSEAPSKKSSTTTSKSKSDVSVITNGIAKELKLTPQQATFVYEAKDFFGLLSAALQNEKTNSEEVNSGNGSLPLHEMLKRTFSTGRKNDKCASQSSKQIGLEDSDRIVLDDALDAVVRDEYKQFRLQVKRNILRFDTEGIKDVPKQDMQRLLSQLFDERVDRYLKLWSIAKILHMVHL